MSDDLEWPREIWMAEREEHDQGVVSAVLSEHATVARWEGDKERDREFHRYVDADIHDSADRYWKARIATLEAERDQIALACRIEKLAKEQAQAERDDLAALLAEAVGALAALLDLNDNHGPFGGEMYQDRVDRTWESARATLAKLEAKT